MSQMNRRVLFTIMAAIAGLGSTSSFAAEATQRIAVVDMQKALQLVEAGKKVKAQLEKEFNAKSTQFQQEEAAIKKMNEELQKQSLAMSDEARAKKQAELQSRFMKFQQGYQQSQEELQSKERTLTQPIITKLRNIIGEVAKNKNYSIVIQKNDVFVLHSEDKDDLTNEVIKIFDKGGHS